MILNSPYISGSLTVTGNITSQGGITISGSITSASYATTSSFATTASYANTSTSASYALTASFATNATNFTASNILASNTITAQTLVVQTVTSSVVYSSGSNIFGNQLTDVQQMTGSLRVTGSITSTGAATFSNNVTAGGNVVVQSGSILSVFRTDNARAVQLYTTSDECVLNSWEATGEPLHIRSMGSAGRIQFFTSGSEKMRITSEGNVGINCTPTTSLTIRPINVSTNALSILDPAGTAQRIAQISFGINTNDGEISLDSNGTNNVRISSNRDSYFNGGNVGIGTGTPAKKLDIYSTATSNTAQIVVSDTGSTNRLYLGTFSNGSYISLGGTYQSGWIANGSNAIANIGMSATNGASTIQFETSTTNGVGPTERMRITASGSVGIGTITPTNGKLEVQTGATTAGLWVQTGGTTTGYTIADFRTGTNLSALQILGNGAATFGSSVAATTFGSTIGNDNLVFDTYGATTGYLSSRIKNSSGSLIIGTEGSVTGNVATGDLAYSSGIYTGTTRALHFGVDQTVAMTIINGGNIGMGTTTPAYRLQLSTDSAAKPSTNTWTISSDIRIKENINPYTKGLETILKINPVTYDYNGKAGFEKIKNNIGIIAQDVLDILPESISTYKVKLDDNDNEESELYNFNSHALTYVLINAIQEQQATITSLQDRLTKAGL